MAYFCRDKEAAKIIQERYNNDIEDRLSDGFNESDAKETPPEPITGRKGALLTLQT